MAANHDGGVRTDRLDKSRPVRDTFVGEQKANIDLARADLALYVP